MGRMTNNKSQLKALLTQTRKKYGGGLISLFQNSLSHPHTFSHFHIYQYRGDIFKNG